MITFNDFQKVEIRVGTILSSEAGGEIVLIKPTKKVLNGSKLG